MRLAPLALLALVLLFPACTSARLGSVRATTSTSSTVPPARTCHYQPMSLPDPACNPGALNPAVTQADIKSTICVAGWTATVRPPSSYTTRLKMHQMAVYGLHGQPTADYEEDHRVPLAVGGNPTDPRNLWPEPWTGRYGAHAKDVLESQVHTEICNGTLTLAQGRRAFLGDWWSYA